MLIIHYRLLQHKTSECNQLNLSKIIIQNFFKNLDNGGYFGKQNGFCKHENIAIFKKLSIHKMKNGRLMIFCQYLNGCYLSVTPERFCCRPSHQKVIRYSQILGSYV